MESSRSSTRPASNGSLSKRAEGLLADREAMGLRWSMLARMVFAVIGLVMAIAGASDMRGMIGTPILIVVVIAVLVRNWRLVARKERQVLLHVGRVNVLVDTVVMIIMPFVWYQSAGGSGEVLASFNAKSNLAGIVVLLTVVNAMAMRPLYPMIVSVFGSLTMAFFVVQAALDERVVWTEDIVAHVLGASMKPSLAIWDVLVCMLVGAFLTALARWARQLVEDVVALQDTNLQIMEAQATAVLEAKMAGLVDLVAGVVHELNTPLGVLISASQTTAKAARKLGGDTPDQKLVKVLDDGAVLIGGAAGRMQELVASLKSFSRLDQAEEDEVDLSLGLESALGMISPRRRGQVVVERDYEQVPRVRARARSINQVFMTLIENAHDAMQGQGTLTLRVAKTAAGVQVDVGDTGCGMSQDQVDALFDLRLAANQGRVGLRLGLPNARRIVQAHGGQIEVVRSQPQEGSIFRVTLPHPPTPHFGQSGYS